MERDTYLEEAEILKNNGGWGAWLAPQDHETLDLDPWGGEFKPLLGWAYLTWLLPSTLARFPL